MFGKTPVTTLQEYCAKKRSERPDYSFSSAADGQKSFCCVVEAFGEMAEGVGRSKKEAKHDAAAQIIKRLKKSYTDIEEILQAPHEAIPMSDAVADLRDLCLQQDHPFPTFEVVQQAGPPEAPEFTVECRVATIVRYAKFSTKKGAKQLAAQKIIDIIQAVRLEDHQMQVATLTDTIHNAEEVTRKKIKTYREFVESDIKEAPGKLITDRHNFFKNLDINLKNNAESILNTEQNSNQEKVHQLLNELQIKYKSEVISSINGLDLIFVQLLCDFDVVFCDTKENIYLHIISYFRDMLK